MTFKIEKPKDRQVLMLFKPAPDWYPHAHVDIARMVYYKRATYAERIRRDDERVRRMTDPKLSGIKR